MIWVHVAIYVVISAASYLAWKKYQDKFMLWCLWIGMIGLAALMWQYCVDNVFQLPELIQNISLLVVEALRLVIFVLLLIAGFRIFKPKKQEENNGLL
jgi:tryptophan-rich sensory protein